MKTKVSCRLVLYRYGNSSFMFKPQADGAERAYKLEQYEIIPIHLCGENGGRLPIDH